MAGSGLRCFADIRMEPATSHSWTMEPKGDTLRISGLHDLSAANSAQVRDLARAAIQEGQRHIEVDLSQIVHMDSSGLGALIALHKTAATRSGTLRVVNPTPPVRQLLELTRMQTIFQVVHR
jgi:anti-sigma B factor antagonist